LTSQAAHIACKKCKTNNPEILAESILAPEVFMGYEKLAKLRFRESIFRE
jgi:hypothetical protein